MKPRTRKAVAIGWLVAGIPFGGVAAFQLYCMFAGIYDPVAHDQIEPARVAGLRAWLIGVIIVTFITSAIAGWYLRHHSRPR